MSRIFEALQRSESERSGTLPQIATELLEAVERDTAETGISTSEFGCRNWIR